MSHVARMRFLKAMIALGLFLGATTHARTQTQTLPPNTVLGRTGITPGPAQAIPFDQLSILLAFPPVTSVPAAGQIFIGQSTGSPVWRTVTGDATLGVTGLLSILKTGNTNKFATSLGTLTSGHYVQWDAFGNAIDGGTPCCTSGTVATGSAGQIAYYNANTAAVVGSALNFQFGGNAATSAQVPSFPTDTRNIAATDALSTQCLVSGGGQAPTYQACQGSFHNLLRNSGLTEWRCGTNGQASNCPINGANGGQVSVTIADGATGGWCVSGIWVIGVGTGSVTCQVFWNPGGNTFSLGISGDVNTTDIKLRFVQEAPLAVTMKGQTATFQIRSANQNSNGVVYNPTISTFYANASNQDDWSVVAADLPAQPMNQTGCTSANRFFYCISAYTFGVSINANKGYEEVIDLGFNTTGDQYGPILLDAGSFDLRLTPGVPTGLNVNPPTPEIRDIVSERLWNKRFYQFYGAWNNVGQIYLPLGIATSATAVQIPFMFQQMRAPPTFSIETGALINGCAITSGSASNIALDSMLITLISSCGGLTTGNAYQAALPGTGFSNMYLEADIPGG